MTYWAPAVSRIQFAVVSTVLSIPAGLEGSGMLGTGLRARRSGLWEQTRHLLGKAGGSPTILRKRVCRAFPSQVGQGTSFNFPAGNIREPMAPGCDSMTEIVPAPEHVEHVTSGTRSEIVHATIRTVIRVNKIQDRLGRCIPMSPKSLLEAYPNR